MSKPIFEIANMYFTDIYGGKKCLLIRLLISFLVAVIWCSMIPTVFLYNQYIAVIGSIIVAIYIFFVVFSKLFFW